MGSQLTMHTLKSMIMVMCEGGWRGVTDDVSVVSNMSDYDMA